ncbi:hypothetical protein [Arthrobacter sp. NIO-1057]|uniref:hypothetical protein n=1 Tax=Arthrobacter sp. NIO-1057 TaxID=993071 RepID=UPI001146D030|nr:hypothetical protein [Arthrobacter sp. NIO-1057]
MSVNALRSAYTISERMMNEEELPRAHENFMRHFTATFYEDESCEFAPFGSDEGWDTLQEATENRNELNSGSTVADVLEITEAPYRANGAKPHQQKNGTRTRLSSLRPRSPCFDLLVRSMKPGAFVRWRH